MMKTILILCVWFSVLLTGVSNVSAQLFGSDKEMNQISRDLKKINARLVEIILAELRNIKNAQARLRANQANLSSQIDRLTGSLPNLQGSVEQTNAEVTRRLRSMEDRLGGLEKRLQEELTKQSGSIKSELLALTKTQKDQLNSLAGHQKSEMNHLVAGQKAEMAEMKKKVGSHLEDIKLALATEIEGLAQKNESSLSSFISQNRQNLAKTESLLNAQNQKQSETIGVLKEIVRLENENKGLIGQNLQAIRSGTETSRAGFSQIQANSALFDEKNKKMIDVIGSSLKDQQAMTGQINALAGNMTRANENINSTKAAMVKLKEILDQKLAEITKMGDGLRVQGQQSLDTTHLVKQNLLVADQKLNKLAEGMKSLQGGNSGAANSMNSMNDKITQMGMLIQQTDQKFIKLIDTTKSVVAQSAKLGQSIDLTIQKLDSGQSDASLTNAKVAKLIDILKAIAAEQNKFNQLISGQEKLNHSISTAKVELSNTVLRSHSEVKQNLAETTNEINQTIVNSQTELGKYVTNSKMELGQYIANTQGEVKQSLEDLRKKANTNISRNDSILNALKAAPRKPTATKR